MHYWNTFEVVSILRALGFSIFIETRQISKTDDIELPPGVKFGLGIVGFMGFGD